MNAFLVTLWVWVAIWTYFKQKEYRTMKHGLTHLVSAVAAIGTSIASVAEAIRNHPAVQDDDDSQLNEIADQLDTLAADASNIASQVNSAGMEPGTASSGSHSVPDSVSDTSGGAGSAQPNPPSDAGVGQGGGAVDGSQGPAEGSDPQRGAFPVDGSNDAPTGGTGGTEGSPGTPSDGDTAGASKDGGTTSTPAMDSAATPASGGDEPIGG